MSNFQEHEKIFRKKLAKAGWHAYFEEEAGRWVTNSNDHELQKLEKISGLKCEIVLQWPNSTSCRVGPVKPPEAPAADKSQVQSSE